MENTYVVYSEEYYFSMNALSTILKKRVYNVSYNEQSAEEIKNMIDESLSKFSNSGELNANNEMLTTYGVKVICLEGKYSVDEAKNMVIDDDYTWGKVGKSR